MLLSGKTVVVTGSNRGIGKSIVEVFAENGANIYACTKKKYSDFNNFIESVSKKNNVIITPISFDLSNKIETKKSANVIISNPSPIDAIVNNAGVISTSLFQMTSMEKIQETFSINFFAQIYFTQFIVKSMIKNKSGSIINISSTSGQDGNEGRLAYSASKASLISMTKVLSKELSRFNIRVNAIAPGLTDTDMMQNNTTKDILEETIKNISLQRVAKPREIANAVLFLASDLSSYITGQTIRVDGGFK